MRSSFFVGVIALVAAVPSAAEQVSPNRPAIATAGDQTEPAIAVDPSDPAHLVAGAIDVPSNGCAFAASFDGGATWATGLLPIGARTRCTDPSVAIDRSGRVYFGGLFYDGNFNSTQIGVAVSTDGGSTFGAPTMLAAPGVAVDKPYLTVDNSGGAADGRVYIAWNTVPGTQCTGPDASGFYQNCPARAIRVAWSNNGGVTFQPPLTLTGNTSNNFGAVPSVGPDGEVYIAWRQFHTLRVGGWLPDDVLYVARSATGIGGYASTAVATLGTQHPAAQVQGTMRTTRYPVVAVSPGGATRGYAYLIYADDPPEIEPVTPALGTGVFVQDVNRAGVMVGYELVGGDHFVGILRDRADTRRIEVPGAVWTMPRGINARNRVVGTYRQTTTGPFHGFVLDGNGFSVTPGLLPFEALDVPGAVATVANGISASGVIVGSYTSADLVSHGFVYNGAFQAIDVPGAQWTQAHDVNVRGVVVGDFQDGTGVHGFILDAGIYTTLDYPGAVATTALSIDSAGTVVGTFRGTDDVVWAFRRDGTVYTTINVPGATTITATAIDDAGVIVGHYRNGGGQQRGFVWRSPASQDVWLTRSGDQGATWAVPLRVNDVVRGDQFDPWMCVDARGQIHSIWLDRRDDPANFLYRSYYATSVDGGLTVQQNVALATQASDPRAASLTSSGAGFVGDYAGLGCGAAAHAVWPDLRGGTAGQDIYHASVACALTDHLDGTVTDGCTKLMWLQQPDLAVTQATDADHDGRYEWHEAEAWARGLVVGGFDDWRLPAARFPDFNCRPGATSIIGIHCAGTEATNLYYFRGVTVAAPAPFGTISYDYYWTGTRYTPGRSWATNYHHGEMGSANAGPGIEIRAWAVRDVRPSDAPAGTAVRAQPLPEVSVEFATVTQGGTTSVTVSDTDPGLGGANFELLGRYYNITTTATTSGSVTVCVRYDEADLAGRDESTLQLAHEEGGTLVPVASTVDVTANVVCATVSSLSWFALGWRTGISFGLIALIVVGVLALLWLLRRILAGRAPA